MTTGELLASIVKATQGREEDRRIIEILKTADLELWDHIDYLEDGDL